MTPYYGASGVVDRIDGFLFDREHVLISEDGENLSSRKKPAAFKADGKFWVNNHAYGYFDPLGDLVLTDPTHTHVNDLRAVLAL